MLAQIPITDVERRALQKYADIHGSRWRAALITDHEAAKLTGVLKAMMNHPEALKEIMRITIVPRSLAPVACYYGPLPGTPG